MTDKEVLLIVYGATKNHDMLSPITKIIEEHIFATEPKKKPRKDLGTKRAKAMPMPSQAGFQEV